MNAVSGMPVLEDAARRRRHLDDRLLQPVEQDREVVRREVADHAVGLVLAEVHPRRRDEVDLAEHVLADQVADLVDRRAVEERVAGHQHEAAAPSRGPIRSAASAVVVASGFSTSTCLPAVERRLARSRGACAAASRRRPRRSSGRRARSSRSAVRPAIAGYALRERRARARRRARRARPARARGARSRCGRGSGPSSRSRPRPVRSGGVAGSTIAAWQARSPRCPIAWLWTPLTSPWSKSCDGRAMTCVDVVVGHRGEQRQRADLLGQPLGDRQAARAEAELGVRLGAVDRERVVHGGRDAVAASRCARSASRRSAAHDEQVVDVVAAVDAGRRAARRSVPAGRRAASPPSRRRSSFQPSSRRSFTRSSAACSASRRAVVPTIRWW